MLTDGLTVSEGRLVERLVPAGCLFGEQLGTTRNDGADRTVWSLTS